MQGEDKDQETPEARRRLLDEAVAVAKNSDVALVFVGYSWKLETEGKDRTSMDLPEGQDELIEAVAAANKKTIVIFNAGGSVGLTRWIDQVAGVIDAWYGGEEGGNAVADVVFGDVNPSGKLPFTFIRKIEDSPSYANYPGDNLHVKYAEGIFVGYRYFDKHLQTTPLFPVRIWALVYHDLRVQQAGTAEGDECGQHCDSERHCSQQRASQGRRGSSALCWRPACDGRSSGAGVEGFPTCGACAGREQDGELSPRSASAFVL